MNLNLKDKINQDLKNAFSARGETSPLWGGKSGDNDIVSTLRFLMSVIKNKELEKRTKLSKEGKSADELPKLSELADEEIISVVLSEIKKRKESIAQYEKGGREDLVKKETVELEILKKYVPEEMPEEELRLMVRKKISEMSGVTMKDFGKIMGSVMSEVKGRAGGDAVKKIIEEELK